MPQQPPTDRRYEELVLRFPLKEGSQTIDRVYILRPRGKEMRMLPMPASKEARLTQGDMHPLAAKLACLTLEQFESLEYEDYSAIMKVVGGFIDDAPPTGPRVSPSSDASSAGGEKNS